MSGQEEPNGEPRIMRRAESKQSIASSVSSEMRNRSGVLFLREKKRFMDFLKQVSRLKSSNIPRAVKVMKALRTWCNQAGFHALGIITGPNAVVPTEQMHVTLGDCIKASLVLFLIAPLVQMVMMLLIVQQINNNRNNIRLSYIRRKTAVEVHSR